MKKVVINTCFGGFGLSPKAKLKLYAAGMTEIGLSVDEYFGANGFDERNKRLAEWRAYDAARSSGILLTVFSPDEKFVLCNDRDISREDQRLVRLVEEMGDAANGACAELSVVEIPDDVEYEIEEYDDLEHIAEKHRTWP